MFNLTEIMAAAQGGQGITNLASQFGLSAEQAQSAVKAMMPGMSMGLQNQAASTDGLSSIISMMTGGAHQEAFNNPTATAAPETAAAGTDMLHQIFGGQAATAAVAQHAANMSGLSSTIMQSMMPVVASMVMGGLFKGASNNGLGGLLNAATGAGGGLAGGSLAGGSLAGMLEQLMGGGAQAAPGGMLGGLMGSLMGGGQQTTQGGGMLGSLLGGLMGGGQQPAAQPANPMAAGLEMLQSMMGHGQQVHETHTNALQDIFSSMMKK